MEFFGKVPTSPPGATNGPHFNLYKKGETGDKMRSWEEEGKRHRGYNNKKGAQRAKVAPSSPLPSVFEI